MTTAGKSLTSFVVIMAVIIEDCFFCRYISEEQTHQTLYLTLSFSPSTYHTLFLCSSQFPSVSMSFEGGVNHCSTQSSSLLLPSSIRKPFEPYIPLFLHGFAQNCQIRFLLASSISLAFHMPCCLAPHPVETHRFPYDH